ncbi:hypothetical protein SPAB_01116 [Salmonella enterica subsp. enterica serovar Paratyphi B str. SPB7]|uniref:Uncharacterized protein n=1 Tax=Salmonella paratyphi B (strain ATCC BAA-1250 / SPB7) TaxID=1016998 RepID=A0A6C6YZT7_SALPB|nr:hypothetical protein SPAB_01116 [Salmonella enterica subsp. enterica serovar Paratyphi B str. SPB7]
MIKLTSAFLVQYLCCYIRLIAGDPFFSLKQRHKFNLCLKIIT